MKNVLLVLMLACVFIPAQAQTEVVYFEVIERAHNTHVLSWKLTEPAFKIEVQEEHKSKFNTVALINGKASSFSYISDNKKPRYRLKIWPYNTTPIYSKTITIKFRIK